MALTDIQQALQHEVSGDELTFTAIGTQVPALGVVAAELPPISVFPIKGVQLALSGTGAAQALTISGTVDWQLLTPTGVTITVTVDPGDATRYVAALEYTAPESTKLAIPGVTWFALGDFEVSGKSRPWSQQTDLQPTALISVGTTLLIEGDSSETKIPITIGDDPTGALRVDLNTAGVALPRINDVLAAFGTHSSSFVLPSTLNDLLSLTIQDLFVCFDPVASTVSQIGVQIGKQAGDGAGWPIIPDFFELDSYALALNVINPLSTAQIGGSVMATGKLGSVDIGISALHPASGGWQFSGYLGKQDPVHLSDLVNGIASQFKVPMPDVLSSFVFKDFELSFDSLTYDANGHFSLDFDVNDTAVDLTVSAALTHAGSSYTVAVDGKLTVGQAVFDVAFGQSPSTFTASWTDTANPLEFEDVAARFGFTDVPPIPKGLDLNLTKASITYDFSSSALVLTAQSKTYGDAAFVAVGGKYFFGLATKNPIVLTDLPLLSSVTTPDTKVQIDGIQVVIASAGIDATIAQTMNGLLKGSGVAVPGGLTTDTSAAVALSMDFTAGGFKQALAISTADSTAQLPPPPPLPAPSSGAGTVASSQASDGTVWYDLQKSFGPVSFQKVGIRYRTTDETLFVLMNAGLDVSALTISVLGLGVGSPLTEFVPTFTIDGVTVTLSAGPLEASGGLMGKLDPVDFYGELVLGFGEFSISALGGYAQYEGSPSFFLYAVLDAPLGGPPFLFVTGVAAGIGFNRNLVMPDVSGVAKFPLVAWADGDGTPAMDPQGDIGKQVAAVMSTLASSGVVAPAVGEYWLAVGVRFTSFEIVDAFALLTVTFGTRFEIDVLGVATLSIPPAVDTPIARVELELLASFSPDTGLLAISAQLTSNSYVLDPAAHLTGGFAFYSWFAGEHEGEFVVTLGGYNPHFTVPDYYPKVPRLGLNWQVIPNELAIQGNLYFALTSNAVMAGGQLSATWASGPISAWFTVWADFLMIFKPFHYLIGAGIDLGASFSIKILFVHIRITIHLGVALEIWGPPLAGVATVDLSIISFKIRFGAGDPRQDTTLPWGDFVDQLLPSQPAAKAVQSTPRFTRMLAAAAPGPTTETAPAAVVQVAVTQGLVKTLDPSTAHPWYLVNGETFQCQVTTLIPFKATTWAGVAQLAPDPMQPHDSDGNVIEPNTTFSGGISGISADDFQPSLSIEVDSVEDSTLYGVRVLRNAPKALWETKAFQNGIPQIDPATGLTQSTVPNTPGGYVLIPEVPEPDQTLPVALDVLEFTREDRITFAWSDPTHATTDPFTTETVAGTITDTHVATVRDVTLAALAGQGIGVDTTLDVARLADPANDDLLAAPTLSLLGEQRTVTTTGDAA